MAHFISLISFLLVALLINQSTQHFLLNYPATIGFDDSVEGTAPCGSFTVDFSKDNVTDFHVGGDAIALMSVHPEATWLFRATLDQTASGNWTTLAPPVLQMGLGDFCEQNVKVPSSFTGSKGVIQVIQDAPDGILYQCAAVNFVAGTIAPPSLCTNVTGLTAAYTSDPALSSIPATASATSGSPMTISMSTAAPSGTSSGSSTGSTSPTPSTSGAMTIGFHGELSSLVWFTMVIASAAFVAKIL